MEVMTISGITQLQDLIDAPKFREIILAGITTAEGWLSEADQLLAAGRYDEAEELWKRAFDNLRWVALNVIQRRLRVGKNEGGDIRGRLREFWRRLMIFGLKRKLAPASVKTT